MNKTAIQGFFFLLFIGLFMDVSFAQTGASSADSVERLPWPDHTKIAPRVTVACEGPVADGPIIYDYTLASLGASEQDITGFDVLSEFEPEWDEAPWSGFYLSEYALRRTGRPARIAWMAGTLEEMIDPGQSLAHFRLAVSALPGITDSNISGWAELMVVEEVPPERRPVGQVPDDRMFVVLKTVGPVFPLEDAEASPAALGGHLVSQATMAQGLGWLNTSLQIPTKLQSLQAALASNNAALSATKIAELQVLIAGHQNDGVTSDGFALLQPSLAFLATKFPPGGSTSQTLQPSKDAFIYDKGPHVNEGANPRLPLKKVTGKPAHFAVGFDLGAVNTTGLTKATLVFSIDSGQNVTGWGNGRTICARRLTTDWVEGNGKSLDLPNNQKTPGSGQGVTWFSPIDTNISNNQANSTTAWSGGPSFTNASTAPLVTIHNHDEGEVRFDVTQDLLAGAAKGWLVTRDDDVGSQVTFFSREGALAVGSSDLGPRLILEYGGTAVEDSRFRALAFGGADLSVLADLGIQAVSALSPVFQLGQTAYRSWAFAMPTLAEENWSKQGPVAWSDE